MTLKDLSSEANGLHILIVGAGIGGLVAAIALRQQGHRVELFERSRFANEVGAAIHLSPNANGVLRKLGIDATEFGAVETEQLREYTPAGKEVHIMSVRENAAMWRHRWLLVHRAHFHDGLKAAAQAAGKGEPVCLHTSSKVVDVDPQAATVTLETGDIFKGDVVIGADGVHSFTRTKISKDTKPFSSGRNAFRFLISRQQALDDPETASIAQDFGAVDLWDSEERRVVIYPCDNNKLLNFVCIHPETDTPTSISPTGDSYNQQIGKEALLEVYKHFNSQVKKLLEKADPQTLKLWPLLDMDTLPTWVEDRLAILGDAAHPFLPYRASGGAMAIEDAVSLAVMLPGNIGRDEVPKRLKVYEKARHERATTIQQMTRDSSKMLSPEKAWGMVAYIYGHDEFDHSAQVLRKHLWSQNPHMYWRQPIVFGPMPGPRQDWMGRGRALKSTQSTFTTASIKFKTSRTLLQNLFPSDRYSFISPGTVARASFSQTTLGGMDWLGGGGYRHIGLYIHGVQYKKENGELLKGTYMPVLFESLADPIVSGREELGMPKLYTAIDVHHRNNSYRMQTSWQGAVWGHFEMEDLQDQDPAADAGTIGGEADDGILVYRYMPKVGRDNKGQAEAEYPIFVPHAAESKVVRSKVTRLQRTTKAKVGINSLDWDALPTIHHVVSRLGEIPIDEIIEAKIVSGFGVPDVSSAIRIE